MRPEGELRQMIDREVSERMCLSRRAGRNGEKEKCQGAL
jgi:hypothetical protein